MKKINVEIKARCENLEKVRKILEKENARYEGLDHQIDYYFNTAYGRLKLRQGNVENNLISYDRPNETNPKLSNVMLCDTSKESDILKEMLTKHLGIRCVVDKKREIYYIKNVKILLDEVESLGTFVEIEASSKNKNDEGMLRRQVKAYMKKLGVKKEDIIGKSYSDMILEK